jgi:AraC-like DNA-binding protein
VAGASSEQLQEASPAGGRGPRRPDEPAFAQSPAGVIHTDEPGFQGITSDSNMRFGLVLPTKVIRQKLDTVLDGQKVGALAFQPSFDATGGAGATIRRMIDWLFAELAEGDTLAVRSFEEHLALGLLLGLLHSHSERLSRQQTAAAPANVKRAEEFTRSNAPEPLTVEAVATATGCSIRALQLAFRRCRGMTPVAALRQFPLEAARAALADGPTSIGAIAAAYRFTNPGRFARLFKEVFGQSPSELRRGQDRPKGRTAADDCRTPNHLIEAQQAAFRRVSQRSKLPGCR